MRSPIPLCWFNRHEPVRNRARWDGSHFVSHCAHCGRDIRRKDTGVWMREWLDTEAHPPGTVI